LAVTCNPMYENPMNQVNSAALFVCLLLLVTSLLRWTVTASTTPFPVVAAENGRGPGYSAGEPLNWKIARVARKFYELQPMGRFVLDRNDCSDFVNCVVDEALGAGARFNRRSDKHVFASCKQLWQWMVWTGQEPVLPGDIIYVRYSPWYPPGDKPSYHVGVVGSDGMVYDFSKLKSWSSARYGRHRLAWFLHNCRRTGDVQIRRLAPAYRYLLKPLPAAVSSP